jgi:hypothetical protein
MSKLFQIAGIVWQGIKLAAAAVWVKLRGGTIPKD